MNEYNNDDATTYNDDNKVDDTQVSTGNEISLKIFHKILITLENSHA